MGVVEVSEGLDDEFGGKVLDGGFHVWGVLFWFLGDEIRGWIVGNQQR
jgi:hypothetical protein